MNRWTTYTKRTSAILLLTAACSATLPSPTPRPPEVAGAAPEEPEPPVVAPPPEPIALPGAITFANGSDALRPESDEALGVVLDYLKRHEETTLLRIEGHTDSIGDEEANQKLSERRALSVASWLVAKGVACNRLLPVGFGKARPVADNTTAEGRAQNRRTVFIAAEIAGKRVSQHADDGGVTAGSACGTSAPTETAPASSSGYLLTGTWVGSAPDGKATYEITVTFGDDRSGTVHYADPYDCSGTWTFDSHVEANRSYNFKEKITEGKGKKSCAASGVVQIHAESDGSAVHVAWGGGKARWDMKRVAR